MAAPTVTFLYPINNGGIWEYKETKNPVISWQYADQDLDKQSQIQVVIYTVEKREVQWDSGPITVTEDMNGLSLLGSGLIALWSDRFYEIPDAANLLYDKQYTVKMRVKDSTGLWSDYTQEAKFIMDGTLVTGIITTELQTIGAIRIAWSPDRINDLNGYNILRSESVHGPYKKLNKNLLLQTEFIDLKVKSNRTYYYRIQVVTNGGHVSDLSNPIPGKIDFDKWFIGTVPLDLVTDFDNKQNRIRSTRVTMGSSNTRRRVIQDGGYLPSDLSVTAVLINDELSKGSDKYGMLLDSLSIPQILSLRDPFGRQWDVSPGDIEENILKTGSLEYEVKMTFMEVSE